MPWTKTDRAIMADVYRLLQSNADPTDDQSWWDDLIRQACEIVNKYDQDALAVEMCTGALLYLDGKREKIKSQG